MVDIGSLNTPKRCSILVISTISIWISGRVELNVKQLCQRLSPSIPHPPIEEFGTNQLSYFRHRVYAAASRTSCLWLAHRNVILHEYLHLVTVNGRSDAFSIETLYTEGILSEICIEAGNSRVWDSDWKASLKIRSVIDVCGHQCYCTMISMLSLFYFPMRSSRQTTESHMRVRGRCCTYLHAPNWWGHP